MLEAYSTDSNHGCGHTNSAAADFSLVCLAECSVHTKYHYYKHICMLMYQNNVLEFQGTLPPRQYPYLIVCYTFWFLLFIPPKIFVENTNTI